MKAPKGVMTDGGARGSKVVLCYRAVQSDYTIMLFEL